MRRDQLEHAIRTACQIIDRPEVIVVGSQAILGTFREDELPIRATMSVEVGILPIADSNEETAQLADRIEGVAGEFSPFEELHGFRIDGVDLETSALPEGWRDRLVKVQNANRPGPLAGCSSPAGASTRKTSASRSCAHAGEGPELRLRDAQGRTRRFRRDRGASSGGSRAIPAGRGARRRMARRLGISTLLAVFSPMPRLVRPPRHTWSRSG